MVESRLADIDAREINSIPIGETPDGQPIMVRVGRYGPYISVGSGEDTARASVPEDLAPDELTVERALELLAQPSGDRDLGIDPGTGEPVTLKIGRYGPYIERGVPPEPAPAGAKNGKAKAAASTLTRASLFKDMDPATVTLDEVLPLLTLPRTLGTDPEKGEPVTAQNGRYGPYVKRGSESRSLATEPQLLTVTLDEALALLATPKLRGRAAAAPPLRELGDDPVSSKPMVIREGRFGPYVTDGETNASLRKGDSIEEITAARASELLADRRARGPAPAKARRTTRAPAKKATKAARARKS
jgi:DNA topoisomerase-1